MSSKNIHNLNSGHGMRKAGRGLTTAQGTDDKHWEAKKMTGDREQYELLGT